MTGFSAEKERFAMRLKRRASQRALQELWAAKRLQPAIAGRPPRFSRKERGEVTL